MQTRHRAATHSCLLLASIVAGGCAQIRVDVDAYLGGHPFPVATARNTVFVEAVAREQPALLSHEVAAAVRTELERWKYVCTAKPDAAAYVLTCAFGIGQDRIRSVTLQHTGYSSYSTHIYGYGGHPRDVHSYGPYTTYQRYEYREFDRYLLMTLFDRAKFDALPEEQRDSAIVWQASAVSTGASRDIRGALPAGRRFRPFRPGHRHTPPPRLCRRQ